MRVKERSTCRVSGEELIDVFSLGELPFSCFPVDKVSRPTPLPLTLSLGKKSGLLQLRHTVDPDEMYDEYWYMSGINQSMRDALQSIVVEALNRRPVNPNDIVVDIASNDGTLLSNYSKDLFRIGIDPAKNIRPKTCNLHINTYFSKECYQKKMGDQKAKIVTSIAMFYDLEDPIQFAKDVNAILEDDGLWVIELSYLPTMLEKNSFDTICSEHLEYYSLQSMEYIFERSGFEVEDLLLNDINGGSFRLYVRKKGHANPSEYVDEIRRKESSFDLCNPKTYEAFGERIEKNRTEMVEFLQDTKKRGKKVVGYGASTKGNTIMAYYGIGADLLPFVADRNPIKYGRHTVTGIPIISEDEARRMKPDYFLAFPYHFMSEFILRENEFLSRGGAFVSPIPKLTLLSQEVHV